MVCISIKRKRTKKTRQVGGYYIKFCDGVVWQECCFLRIGKIWRGNRVLR